MLDLEKSTTFNSKAFFPPPRGLKDLHTKLKLTLDPTRVGSRVGLCFVCKDKDYDIHEKNIQVQRNIPRKYRVFYRQIPK